jgi:TRAP-type C4-dicarboxylate transport system permease small subunit
MSDTVPGAFAARDNYAPAHAFAPDRALSPVRRALRWTSLVLVAVMIALPAIQVVLREIIQLPFIGAEELTRFMLICVVFLTLPYVVVSGANIRLEEGLHLLPRPVRRLIHIAIGATGVLTFGVAAAAIAVATMRNLQNATPTLGIPYWVFFSATFVGFLVAAVEFALQLWKAATRRPLFVTFADEASPEDMDALEAALIAEADRGAGEARP